MGSLGWLGVLVGVALRIVWRARAALGDVPRYVDECSACGGTGEVSRGPWGAYEVCGQCSGSGTFTEI
jgi:hypothetical protein